MERERGGRTREEGGGGGAINPLHAFYNQVDTANPRGCEKVLPQCKQTGERRPDLGTGRKEERRGRMREEKKGRGDKGKRGIKEDKIGITGEWEGGYL